MKRLIKEADSLPILHTTIPPLMAERESKLRGGFVTIASAASIRSFNVNVVTGDAEGQECGCKTNKKCQTVIVTYTPTNTGTSKSSNAIFDELF